MDLIYTNADREDVGVLFDYQFDLAFGADENDFQLTIPLNKHCCQPGSFIYIEGTEYGGIVDSVEVDTERQEVVYSGRTWHGILEGHIIQPETGYDYYVVSGDAHTVIAAIIEKLKLDDIFTVSAEESDIQIGKYKFARYTDAYKGICDMLADNSGKLMMEHRGDKIILSAVWHKDFSKDEEWDDSQVDFNVKKNYRPVNHLVCLGSGSLKDRHIIHLFTDGNGGIQPYTTKESPVKDSDYILDTTKQVLFGLKEVAEVYDYSGAQTAENYVLLTEQPKDWSSNYENYFKLGDGDSYVGVEGTWKDVYTELTTEPTDWAEAYTNYFVKKGDTYKAAEGETSSYFEELGRRPSDWETNYKNYYYKYSDGLSSSYRKVGSESVECYEMMTTKPSDWDTNFGSYYEWKNSWTETSKSGEVTEYESGYYRVESENEGEIVRWLPGRFYTMVSNSVAPVFETDKYFKSVSYASAPVFKSGEYYSYEYKLIKPSFMPDTYYELVYDNYADLVAGGLDKLKSSQDCDSISIDLELEGNYDIGDIVGAVEHTTGVSVWQPITKKIVTIKDGQTTISYKVGD